MFVRGIMTFLSKVSVDCVCTSCRIMTVHTATDIVDGYITIVCDAARPTEYSSYWNAGKHRDPSPCSVWREDMVILGIGVTHFAIIYPGMV